MSILLGFVLLHGVAAALVAMMFRSRQTVGRSRG
jgi:hypothetical protein